MGDAAETNEQVDVYNGAIGLSRLDYDTVTGAWRFSIVLRL